MKASTKTCGVAKKQHRHALNTRPCSSIIVAVAVFADRCTPRASANGSGGICVCLFISTRKLYALA
eukprot:4047850-Pleurochrysis_carterae.AAC.1